MDRIVEETFELEEAEVFGADELNEEEEEAKDAGSSDHEEQEAAETASDTCDEDDVFGAQPTALTKMEMGPNSGSAKSTTLNVVLEDEGTAGQDAAAGGWGGRAKRSQPRGVACSLPVSTAGIQMGSSVPINIPFMGGRGARGPLAGAGAGAEPQYPATFVPPYQLSQREDFTFSFTGESPGAAIKRDRLRVRNAILKSTGFLEHPVLPAIGLAGVPDRSSLTNKGVLGGLSQALHAVGSPQATR